MRGNTILSCTMTLAVVNPELLQWARKRANMSVKELSRSVHKNYPLWENGKAVPTRKQLERIAKKTHAAMGYFDLPEPPADEPMPIPDFRTEGSEGPRKPSVELLDTIRACLQRQKWYRHHAVSVGHDSLPFVRSARLSDNPAETGRRIRDALGMTAPSGGLLKPVNPSLKGLVQKAEGIGILVMVSSFVEPNTRRRLDPEEFRGFALTDAHAPVVFINGADAKVAQKFSLAHELAHVWLGKTALSNYSPFEPGLHEQEAWCNMVAAELLVPGDGLRKQLGDAAMPKDEGALRGLISSISAQYRVSNAVSVQRLRNEKYISQKLFRRLYCKESRGPGQGNKNGARQAGNAEDRGKQIKRASEGADKKKPASGRGKKKGGRTQRLSIPARASKRFTAALVHDTVNGHTTYRDAMRLLRTRQLDTIDDLAKELERPE